MSTLELEIGGMTCASCANRIEKKLNRLDGVEASVNYATEKAHVVTTLDPARIIEEVEKTGYTAHLPEPEQPTEAPVDLELLGLRQRLIGSIVLSLPVIILAMVPALQFN
ncbi:MAG TPA: cation transporter, partial [Marmoricola sp.]|nr:cation transporter [Marmoricola sp.]